MPAHRKISIGWRFKSVAFYIFNSIPFGNKVYYWFQRYITHSQPRPYVPTFKSAREQIKHARRIAELYDKVAELKLLEIGAGWDLYANLIYYCFGLDHQIAVDIRRWARAETIHAAICHLQSDPPKGAMRLPSLLVSDHSLEQDLKLFYGIRYIAPFDATSCDIDTGSIDVITTTSVFEHIPSNILPDIMKEFRRIIRNTGLMSHVVDYSDHYAHADPRITDFHYLRFSENEWKKHNPSIHFQNRLRTRDYIAIFSNAGFDVVSIAEWKGPIEALEQTSVDASFQPYSREELLALGADFICRPSQVTSDGDRGLGGATRTGCGARLGNPQAGRGLG